MKISDIEQELVELGCKSVHIERFWRNWYLGKPLTRAKFNFPEAISKGQEDFERRLNRQLRVVEEVGSDEHGTRIVSSAADGQLIESVLLPRNGVCVSTQVGCAVGCVFCMTGKSGLVRQLSDLEIVSQAALAMRRQPIKKVVFMGMGEPSHNLRAVLSALKHLARYAAIGYKELVISTVGDRRLFEALLKEEVKPALAVSLHSAFDEKRKKLLPKASPLTVKEIFDFTRTYAQVGKYPIQYQWTLMDGINDEGEEIEELKKYWHRSAVLNMIPVNVVEGSPFKRPQEDKIREIQRKCKESGILLKFRDSAAQDVDGGCGQLRARILKAAP